jgi:uncharacterized iron-regulated membrane protein
MRSVLRVLTWLHRWWGVVFCLLFAMWFASGIVMHFVPFPARDDADRFAALLPIDLGRVGHGPAEAIANSGIPEVSRIRLVERSDGPIYLVSAPSATQALRASDLADGRVGSDRIALETGIGYARFRGLDASHARVGGLVDFDQWSVSGEFDSDRPLYRIILDDNSGTELYVSSATGDMVLQTTRLMRGFGYIGSVAHWIYPAVLRHHARVWLNLIWWLSLLGCVGAGFGVVIALARLTTGNRLMTPAPQRLHTWHYRLGLFCAPFVLAWMFSGWLSVQDGRSSPDLETRAATLAIAGTPAWSTLPLGELGGIADGAREIEWFALAGRIYRRERVGLQEQVLSLVVPETGDAPVHPAFLRQDEIDSAAKQLGGGCAQAAAVDADEADHAKSALREAPVFRIICGDTWNEIDGATGALLSQINGSQRAYRWLFGRLHTLDFPMLQSRPMLRTSIIVALCLCGLAFSLTGVVLAWRRLGKNVRAGPDANRGRSA